MFLPVAYFLGVLRRAIFTAKGQLISSSAPRTPSILSPGANGTLLKAATAEICGLKWEAGAPPIGTAGGDLSGTYPNPILAAARIFASVLTAKGSLVGATAAATPADVPVGADGLFLQAASAQPNGLTWASAGMPNYTLTFITATGTYVPPATGQYLVMLHGGGAGGTGGSAGSAAFCGAGGGGGASGQFVASIVSLTSGVSKNIIIGHGGSGGAGGVGTAGGVGLSGGDTTWESTVIVAPGGASGTAPEYNLAYALGGLGGAGLAFGTGTFRRASFPGGNGDGNIGNNRSGQGGNGGECGGRGGRAVTSGIGNAGGFTPTPSGGGGGGGSGGGLNSAGGNGSGGSYGYCLIMRLC